MAKITEIAFWQLWPQTEQDGGERRVTGLEVELIGCHNSDPTHVDPACPMCRRVRFELLGIAHLMLNESGLTRDSLTCSINARSNSVLCLPALGNRSAVCVSITLSWKRASGQGRETELLGTIKSALSKHGIHQR